jgi:membrane protease YdiL (CAAX protease family)
VSAGVALWTRIAFVTAAALVLAAVLAPPTPSRRLEAPAATVVGGGAGLALFVGVARRRPSLPGRHSSVPLLLAKVTFFGLWAMNEELLWRRVALGELLALGAVPALVASTLGFALTHRTRRRVHLATGGVFGSLYLATGALVASVIAHWTYNVLVAGLLDGELQRAHGPP